MSDPKEGYVLESAETGQFYAKCVWWTGDLQRATVFSDELSALREAATLDPVKVRKVVRSSVPVWAIPTGAENTR